MNHDDAAIAEARSHHAVLIEGTCGTCTRPMYKEAPYPGVANEWRHRSTGHPLSWNPERHNAGVAGIPQHSLHRFERTAKDGRRPVVCAIVGCDATMTEVPPQEATEALTGRAAREAASRRRGVVNSKRSLGNGTGF